MPEIYKCLICEKQLANNSSLKTHMRIHSDENFWKCGLCEQQFKLKSSLDRHQLVHTKERKYECNICHKKFGLKQSLIPHMRIHKEEKPYVCDVCGMSFTQSSSLTRHCRIHTGEKKYECDVCGKRVAHLHTLKEHKRIHTGEKPFECPICGKKFAFRNRWKKHKLLHSDDKPHKCPECPAQYVEKGSLKKHVFMVHTEEGRAIRKQKEHQFSLFLQKNNIQYDRNVCISFSCFESKLDRCYIDFVIEKGTHRFALELDEHQHGNTCAWYYSINEEVQRMRNVIRATTISETKGKLVWIRFNPDAYKINDVKGSASYAERKKKLLDVLANYVPTNENEIIYMYYDIRDSVPEITLSPEYDKEFSNMCNVKCIF